MPMVQPTHRESLGGLCIPSIEASLTMGPALSHKAYVDKNTYYEQVLMYPLL